MKRYQPTTERLWKDDGEGGFAAHVYGRFVLVEVFTCTGWPEGSENRRAQEPFTALECYIGGTVYCQRIPRHYSTRWILRLARKFELEAWNDKQMRMAGVVKERQEK